MVAAIHYDHFIGQTGHKHCHKEKHSHSKDCDKKSGVAKQIKEADLKVTIVQGLNIIELKDKYVNDLDQTKEDTQTIDTLSDVVLPEESKTKHHTKNDHAKHDHNLRAALVHIIGDIVQSIGVVISAIIIYYQPNWVILDPIVSILFTIISIAFSLRVLRDTVLMLLDSTPKNINYSQLVANLRNIENVTEIHDSHLWSIGNEKHIFIAHIQCKQFPDFVLKKATLLCRQYGIYHSTI